jgi:hypothetical protein
VTGVDLERWLAEGSLKAHQPSRNEIADLLAVADRDLEDARISGLSLDRRFATAYAAELQLATVVLRASGYRASANMGGHHWRTIGALPMLMGEGQEPRKVYLDSCRRARNEADYDRIGVVSESELVELLEDTVEFRQDVLAWLSANHPELSWPQP